MKVIIAGSRNMPVSMYSLVDLAVKKSGFKIEEVVCGMARGADMFGAKWAYENKIPLKRFPADWKGKGKWAGFTRNQEMADYAEGLIVFIWPDSRGSRDMLERIQEMGKPFLIVENGVLE